MNKKPEIVTDYDKLKFIITQLNPDVKEKVKGNKTVLTIPDRSFTFDIPTGDLIEVTESN